MKREFGSEMTDTATSTESGSASSRGKRRVRSTAIFFRDLALIFLIAVVASVLLKTFVVRSFYIPSSSMENTLQVNDRILVNELEPRFIPIERGNVVVFRDPGGWLNPRPEPAKAPLAASVDWVLDAVGLVPNDNNDHLIKRVIGLPGDHVVCCNALGQMSVNDVPLKESYLKLPAGTTKVSDQAFDVVVPEGSLWVMGDNRYNSADSRFNRGKPGNGFVPIDNVVGRALWVTWPLDRWSWLDNYPDVFRAVPSQAPPSK